MNRTHLAWMIVATLALAGCTGPSDSPDVTSSPSAAAKAESPRVDSELGAVTGQVVDDEVRPIAGALVSLSGDTRTETDDAGQFTLSGIQPGKHTIKADAIGYQPTTRQVVVAAGLVARIDLVLVPVPSDAPYVLSIPRNYFIQLDQFQVSQRLHNQGNYNHSAICGNCISTLFFERRPLQVVTEGRWATGTGPINGDASTVEFRWKDAGYNAMVVSNGGRNELGASALTRLQDSNATSLEMTVGSGPTTVSFQQTIQTWTSFAYLERLTPEFTAFPPK